MCVCVCVCVCVRPITTSLLYKFIFLLQNYMYMLLTCSHHTEWQIAGCLNESNQLIAVADLYGMQCRVLKCMRVCVFFLQYRDVLSVA